MSEYSLPVLPVRNVVVFPGANISFKVGRDFSISAVEAAMEKFNRRMITLTQKNSKKENPDYEDFYETGVMVNILQLIELPDGIIEVLIDGLTRVDIKNLEKTEDCFYAAFTERKNKDKKCEDVPKYRDILEELLFEFMGDGNVEENILYEAFAIAGDKDFLDFVVAVFPGIDVESRQHVLEAHSLKKRYKIVISILKIELEMKTLEKRIDKDVRNSMEQSQKEHYIRERMNILKKELDNSNEFFDDFSNIRSKAKNFSGPQYVKSRIDKELDRLDKLPPVSSESGVITSYVETLLSIPWNKKSKNEKINMAKAEKVLEKEHFGLNKVKQRVLEYIAVLKLKNGNPGAQIICFAGPPGVGKTSIALSVAHALGRKFVRQALGGIKDEAEIRGHRRTYIGAMPGRIIKSFIKAGAKNPVILLDEIDKLGKDFRGDPASALLEVLDPEQNSHFVDNYIDLETDLSEVLFLATANDISLIPPTLRDRLEIIRIDGYTAFEKEHIARKYLLPKQKKRNGVNLPIRITKSGFLSLLYKHTEEAGVRELERVISTLCRKIAFNILKNSDEKKAFTITAKTVSEYLGVPKYCHEKCEVDSEIGVVNGLAWTTAGGKLLKIEATRFPGDGSVKITGHLGEVMKESVSTAMSFVRSISVDMLGTNMKVWHENDIHIHFPEGAVPKDGPSAGVAIALTIASVISDTPVKSFVAVTGESTLRGHVLKIGGLKAKLMAAKNAGIKTAFIPEANKTELSEIPDEIKEGIEIISISHTSTIIKNALIFSGKKPAECNNRRKSAGIQ